MNEKVFFQIGFCHKRSFSVQFEFESSGCKEITTSPFWKVAAIFFWLLVSNCLFIYTVYTFLEGNSD